MKKIIGIVSEYNPFHEGHRFHIEESCRLISGEYDNSAKAGAQMDAGNGFVGSASIAEKPLVICCMSGDFVQRGEWAILPKHERAAAAIRGGADLIVELPLPWCLSSAEKFAEGAVSLLLRMGMTHLSFGSECGDIALLREAAEIISEPGFQDKVAATMKTHPELTYPAARGLTLQETVENFTCNTSVTNDGTELTGNAAAMDNGTGTVRNAIVTDGNTGLQLRTLMESPNNLLGVEYLKALLKLKALTGADASAAENAALYKALYMDDVKEQHGASVCPNRSVIHLTVKRTGSSHDGADSAKEIREKMRRRGEGADSGALNLAAVSRLRSFDRAYFENLADGENGAGDRIYEAVRSGACTVDEICARAKTRSLTYVRLKRICMRGVLGIAKELTDSLPPYARILAANENGRRYLAENRKAFSVPVVILSRDVRELDNFAQRVYACGVQARDFYNLGFLEKCSTECGEDCRIPPYMA